MRLITGKWAVLIVAVLATDHPSAAAHDSRGLKIIQTSQANFPPALLAEGISSGQVRAVLHIGADGRLVDHLILGFTHRALASELTMAMPEWEFVVPHERGEPVGIRTIVNFHFEARGAVMSLTAISSAATLTRWIAEPEISALCDPRALDRPLQAVQTVPPFHPGRHLRPAQPGGTAVVDFYVDGEGRPRMPVVVSASHEAFGAAASAAITRWRFAPPTREGLPVLVRVRQQFDFNENS